MEIDQATRPAALASMTEEQVVELDARPVLRAGGEPFGQIMEAVASVPPGGAFRLYATFKPVPLFGVMKMKGWNHWVEYGAGDDWCVWFYRRNEA